LYFYLKWEHFSEYPNTNKLHTCQCSGFVPEPPEFWPLYWATGTAVRFSGISEFPRKLFKLNIYFLLFGHTINQFCIVLKRNNDCFKTGVLACPASFLFRKKLLFLSRFIWRANVIIFVRRIIRFGRYHRGNQNRYVEEEQTTQWPKEKVQKDKQRSTKNAHKQQFLSK
jgi:hypothetical protein